MERLNINKIILNDTIVAYIEIKFTKDPLHELDNLTMKTKQQN